MSCSYFPGLIELLSNKKSKFIQTKEWHPQKLLAQTIAWLVYPATILLSLTLHRVMVSKNFSLQISTYVPVILASILIAALERYFFYRQNWLSTRADVSSDVQYLALVQILVPKLLSFLIALTISERFISPYITAGFRWPHQSSTLTQAILMLLSADFLRYWLHRVTHTRLPLLWKLHAIHHSPTKLYWMNVGRFHPLEKVIQFLFDTLPFILLGVQNRVLALYFVFYAVNGFFQHCNIKVHLGLLNYIISGPELHRWHHSSIIHQANRNYGNNLIIWDLLFRTYYRPKGQAVRRLGV